MAASVVGSVDEFGLEGAEKRFGGCVVPTRPGPSHRLCDAICPAELGGGPRGVLTRFKGSTTPRIWPPRVAIASRSASVASEVLEVWCHGDTDNSADARSKTNAR